MEPSGSLGLVVVACLVGVTVVVCALRLLASRRMEDVPLVLAALVAWLAVNKPLEGPVLLGISEDHGVTLADVLVVPPAVLCLAVAARASVRWSRRRRTSPTGSATPGRHREPADRGM